MYTNWLKILSIGVIWATIPFVEKGVLKKFTPRELVIVRFLLFGLFALILFFGGNQKNILKTYKNASQYDISRICIGAVLSGIAFYLFTTLLKAKSPVKFVPLINPITILATLLISTIVLGEEINIYSCVGILLIVIGIILIIKKKVMITDELI